MSEKVTLEVLKEVAKNYLEVNYKASSDTGICVDCMLIVVVCGNQNDDCPKCGKYLSNIVYN